MKPKTKIIIGFTFKEHLEDKLDDSVDLYFVSTCWLHVRSVSWSSRKQYCKATNPSVGAYLINNREHRHMRPG